MAEFIYDFSVPVTEDYSMERMDFRLSDKDNFYWRNVFDPSDIANPGAEPPFVNETTGPNHFAVISETHVFSPTKLNDFRFSFNRTAPTVGTGPLVIQNHALDFVPGAGFGQIFFTALNINSVNAQVQQLGTNASFPRYFPQNIFQEADTFSYVRGPHSWKLGFDMERIQTGNNALANSRGLYSFSSLSSFLASQPNLLTLSLVTGLVSPNRGWRQDLFDWFVQDDFRVRPNLTLNLGLRHEFVSTPNEVNGKSANLRNMTDPKPTIGSPWVSRKLNLSPRVGLAWDPTGQGKTSGRMGAGLFYNQLLGRIWYLLSQADSLFLKFQRTQSTQLSKCDCSRFKAGNGGGKNHGVSAPHALGG